MTRSTGMKAELDRIRITDTPENRALLREHLQSVIFDDSNIVNTERIPITSANQSYPEGFYIASYRESFLMGPYGGVKLTTVWDGVICQMNVYVLNDVGNQVWTIGFLEFVYDFRVDGEDLLIEEEGGRKTCFKIATGQWTDKTGQPYRTN
jgi:hypothetical protein